MTTEQRLDELETRLVFQDRTVQELNDALTDQQRQLDQQREALDRLRQRLEALAAAMPLPPLSDEVPPHY
jgi:SlyX protein